ncbi:DUF2917 domain-containing protein [Mitsuaria sp. GD03876]|uniref:DUF2917 domain-containing protein n=1 Tax=Mitsuaria sp. GD03876 TaxID=2975399 RepID=UPI00244C33FC|nr:DUF2917 domain-containing protein [Mitsuaria sp. GD03876]MDH0865467.1 DUF2917 domain-containing protein [Mitsuaria sp. GD03876]
MNVMQKSSIQVTRDDAAWALSPGEAMSLPIGPGRRELHVLEGRVWVTQRGDLSLPAQDFWLSAGETLEVDSGAELVVEAWPAARFQLLVPPQACQARQASVSRRPSFGLFGQRLANA